MQNEKWTLRGRDAAGNQFTIPAEVPGCVHTDLIRAGLLKDIFYRDNARACTWIENDDFTYLCDFDVPAPAPNAFLEFDGLDVYCTVTLNGTVLGRCDDMFRAYAFPVDGLLKPGRNRLEVAFRSPVKEVEGRPLRVASFTAERLYTRRIQCTYGWDWVARFVTMGIYRPVRLAFRKANEIDGFYLYTKNVNPCSAQLSLTVNLRDFRSCGDALTLRLRDPDGQTLYEKRRTLIEPELFETLDVPSPHLWYPAGYGPQPLYTLELETPSSRISHPFGIREAVILQLPDGPEEKARCARAKADSPSKDFGSLEDTACFTLLVNGVKIFCKGGNWVPCEPFPSAESSEKIMSLLAMAKNAGVNMLRVWGGGVFEKDVFYEECDRLGILVTQDFLMACGEYPEDDPDFLQKLREETEYAAKKLRNRTCLVWWSGDNENAVMGSENRTDFPGYKSAAYGIAPVLRTLDPARPFLPSSPYGGDPYCSATRGTTHNTFYLGDVFSYILTSDFAHYMDFFDAFIARFNAEQPIMGLPFTASMERFMTNADIFGENEEMHEYHSQCNPALPQTLYGYMRIMAEKIFGPYASGKDRVWKLQALQCEWVRQSMELFRRNKWFSSGILYWMFNDCWPAANSWSIVDYYGCPKPAYYAFRRGAKPFLASVTKKDGRLLVYGCNDSLKPVSGTGTLSLYDFAADETVLEKPFSFQVAANASQEVLSCDFGEWEAMLTDTRAILCDVESNAGKDRAHLVTDRYLSWKQPFGSVEVLEETPDSVTVRAGGFTPFAILDRTDLLDDNCFLLKKGEVRTLKRCGLPR